MGAHLNLRLVVTSQIAGRPEAAVALDTLRNWEVLAIADWDSSLSGTTRVYSRNYLVTCWEPGQYRIPAAVVRFQPKSNTAPLEAEAAAFSIEVDGVEVDENADFKPIKDPAEVPWTLGEILSYALPILFVLGLLVWLVLIFISARKRKAQELAPPPAKVSLETLVLRKLDEIDAAQLWQQGQLKEYYDQITDTIRAYIEKRFRVRALESVTFDIIRELNKKGLSQPQQKQLQDLLEAADLAKFAKGTPEAEDNLRALEMARDFVRNTAPEQATT